MNAIAVDREGRGWAVRIAGNGHLPGSSAKFGSRKKCVKGLNCSAAFLSIVDPSLKGRASLTYSGLIGGNGNDAANAVALDNFGDAFIGGETSSTDFPITSNAVQTKYAPRQGCSLYRAAAFVTVVKPGETRPVYSTYLGGADVIPPLNFGSQNLKPLVEFDAINAISVDGSGRIHAAGLSFAAAFPITSDAEQKQCKACTSFGSDGVVIRIKSSGAERGISARILKLSWRCGACVLRRLCIGRGNRQLGCDLCNGSDDFE